MEQHDQSAGQHRRREHTEATDENETTALVRTMLAKERTYSAWVRTGLAALAAGLGIVRLLQELEPRWVVYALGSLLVMTGGVLFGLSFWRYRQPVKPGMRPSELQTPVWMIGALTIALLVAAGLGLWLIW